MGLIRPELCELFALEFAKIDEFYFVYTLASLNLDQLVPNIVNNIHVYDNEILDEFVYKSNLTVTSGVICP